MRNRFSTTTTMAIILAAAVAVGFSACNKKMEGGASTGGKQDVAGSAKAPAAAAETSMPKDFSAEITTKGMGGLIKGKLYVSNGKTRMEMPEGIIIGRLDKNLIWMLMPQMKMYMEHPFQPQNAAFSSDKMPGETAREQVGQEGVGGRKANKFKITYDVNGKSSSIFQWVDAENGMPVRTAAVDGSWMNELANIQVGAQDAGLFEIPAGFNKMSMPAMK
ncbi:MAG: DUF4412 domain-containing protein [bacterium]